MVAAEYQAVQRAWLGKLILLRARVFFSPPFSLVWTDREHRGVQMGLCTVWTALKRVAAVVVSWLSGGRVSGTYSVNSTLVRCLNSHNDCGSMTRTGPDSETRPCQHPWCHRATYISLESCQLLRISSITHYRSCTLILQLS